MALVGYSGCTPQNFTAPVGTGTFARIVGSANREVRLCKIIITGAVAGTRDITDIVLYKTFTPAVGGFPISLYKVPKRTASPVSTASKLEVYTIAPTPGNSITERPIGIQSMSMDDSSSTGRTVLFDWTWNGKLHLPTLDGLNESLELRFGASNTVTTAVLTAHFEWEEE